MRSPVPSMLPALDTTEKVEAEEKRIGAAIVDDEITNEAGMYAPVVPVT